MANETVQGSTSSDSMAAQQSLGSGAAQQGGPLIPGETVPLPAASHSGPIWGGAALILVVLVAAIAIVIRWRKRSPR